MKRSGIAALASCLSLLVAAAPVVAQWVNHPTPGIPRTKDGKPNLAAPAPRTAEHKPDLSGMWSVGGLGHATNITDVEMLPWAQSVYKERLETYGHDDPAVSCLPEGPRAGIAGLDPLRIIQTPNLIVILYEVGAVRQIYLDGRPLPTDPTPSWMGYSVGRWEGNTLVVETTGYNDKTWLDFTGHPHSEALRVTERFRRTDFGHMQLTVTYDDPKTYVKPWTVTMAASFQADTDLIENICLENEKDRARLIGRTNDELQSERKVARSILDSYTGTYEGPLGAWQLVVEGDQLKVQMADGGGKQPLSAQSDTVFNFQAIGGAVRFAPDATGTVSQFFVTVVEGDFPMTRKR